MADPNFFPVKPPVTLLQIAQAGGGELSASSDGGLLIHGVGSIDMAQKNEITFLSNSKYANQLAKSNACACILAPDDQTKAPQGMSLILSNNPYLAYSKIANIFYPPSAFIAEISDRAFIDDSASIGDNCRIEAGAYLGAGVIIGDNSYVGANSYIDKGVKIGNDCRILSSTTISHSIIGNHVTIHTGTRIGQDGFGYANEKGIHTKIPQLGRVMIHDHVEIGANTCIDRGAGPDTVIGEGTKIDNLVQIGHNVTLGKGCVVVSQVGISGSTKIGDYVVLGGKVGIAGHLNIADNVNVAAKSGITNHIKTSGIYGGFPAVPIKQWHKQTIALKKLAKRKGD